MVDIKTWITSFTEKVEQTFPNRVWFIGLQGSYGRGEATETSDIDVVVILDVLRIDDLKVYRDMLDTLPNRDLICGFISGKNELLNWETSDLFQFYYEPYSVLYALERAIYITPAFTILSTRKATIYCAHCISRLPLFCKRYGFTKRVNISNQRLNCKMQSLRRLPY